MRNLWLLVTMGLLLFCLACGSSSSGNTPVGVGSGSFSKASLQGNYVYQISGTDLSTGAPYREAGVFTADGNGNLTNGVDDFEEGTSGVSPSSINGTYSVNTDGTGGLIFNIAGGSLNFSITLANASAGYVMEADSFANGSGTIERQGAAAAGSTPAGTFAFRMHTIAGAGSASMVGVVTVSGGGITGSDDVERGGVLDNSTGAPLTLTGSLSSPDSLGRGTGSIADSAGVSTGFVYYIVDSNHFRMLSHDVGIIGLGLAEKRSGPFSTSSLSGGYAFGSSGDDNTYLGGVVTAGRFTADGTGTISNGLYDSVQDGNATGELRFTGNYSIGSNGRAVLTLNLSGGSAQQIFWLVSPSRAYFLTNDSTKVEDGTADRQTGTFSAATLNGQYAFVMDGFDLNNLVFVDRVGWIQWMGNGSLNWNEVVNDSGTFQQPPLLSGTYSVQPNGRAAATVDNLSVTTGDLVFYLISGNSGYAVQSDPGVEIRGNMNKQ